MAGSHRDKSVLGLVGGQLGLVAVLSGYSGRSSSRRLPSGVVL